MPIEEVEESDLLRAEVDRGAGAGVLTGSGIKPQVANLGGALTSTPTADSAQARGQLTEGERLGQVVVRADVETCHPILDTVAVGEYLDRCPTTTLWKCLADVEAVLRRDHDVEEQASY